MKYFNYQTKGKDIKSPFKEEWLHKYDELEFIQNNKELQKKIDKYNEKKNKRIQGNL